MVDLGMIMECAPNVAPVTIQRIIQVESRGNPIAINVNDKLENGIDENGKSIRRRVKFTYPIKVNTKEDAVIVAYAALDAGHTVDLGYMQVNSTNLKPLGYSVEEMFEPCKNIAAGSRVLSTFYASAYKQFSDEQTALKAALSAYNTGNFKSGFTNGYVGRYGLSENLELIPLGKLPKVPEYNPYTASTAIYQRQEITMNNITDIRTDPTVSESQEDITTPGVQVKYSAAEAEKNGAFAEDAMSEATAWESNIDANSTAIVIGGKIVTHKGE